MQERRARWPGNLSLGGGKFYFRTLIINWNSNGLRKGEAARPEERGIENLK